jgi:O-antigen/teichoic acid export membrane protein
VITILVNVIFIPKFGYMASAWATLASYTSMIIMSFFFAEKHYKVNYDIIKILPYFIVAVAMVVFRQYFKYPNLILELFINTGFIIIFISYAQYKDKIITVFFSKQHT